MDNNTEYRDIPLDVLRSSEDVPVPVKLIGGHLERGESLNSSLKIKISRDLSIPISSVAVSFCLVPANAPEGSIRRVSKMVCRNASLNLKKSLSISVKVSDNSEIAGGCIYISNVTYENGMELDLTPVGLEKYTGESKAFVFPTTISSGQVRKNNPTPPPTPVSSGHFDDYRDYAPSEGPVFVRRKRPLRIIIAALCTAVLACSIFVATYLVSKGQRVENIAEWLVIENRYNEAYKIVSDTMYKGVLQRVCESASNYYVNRGDFCNAYVYAKAAPQPYDDVIIDQAKNALLASENSASINFNAVAVVHQINDPKKFDAVISSLSEICCENKKYGIAMTLAGEIGSKDIRNSVSSVIFTEGIMYFMDNGQYEDVGELIDAFGFHEDVAGKLTDVCASIGISVDSLIEDCYNNGGSAAAIILSNYLDKSSADIPVNPEDQSIRKNLKTVYPLLSAEQKRIYHSQKFAYYKEAYLISDGVLMGSNIINAVSVDVSEFQTAVLNTSGKVSSLSNNGHNLVISIPQQGNTVQIATGQKHIVLLDSNGTVKAYGNNTQGQCDTSEWTDIIAVAAGANFTLGLKADGTLIACGSNASGQCDVSGYTGVIDIDAMDQTAVLLFADGTVGVQGDISMGIKNARSFENVRRISAGDGCIVAETADGKYLMAEGTVGGSCGSVSGWKDAKYFSAGCVSAAYVNSEGKIIYTGDGSPKY